MTKTAINPTRQQNFSQWYQQVIKSAELADNSVVRGCMVIRPYAYAIWENIQNIFDGRLKQMEVQNAYFPLLIPVSFLAKEAQHIEGFAKECAVVTHSRLRADDKGGLLPDGLLPEPYVIRPTSEAIIGNAIAGWINTYRDLPLKLNQWCNVMRWEMRPRLFLRTSEFLWQEGHTIFATAQEAMADAEQMLRSYQELLAEDLCLPVVAGEKPSEERFPGAQNTYTLEVMTQDGKALQAATSHYLEQSFAKAFDITFAGPDGQRHHAYTCSWGISTRLIGAIIMCHADDDGMVLPPLIAPKQVMIIPVNNGPAVQDYCQQIKGVLSDMQIRTAIDCGDASSSSRMWHWIKRGVPIIMMVGDKEVQAGTCTIIRRDNIADKVSLDRQHLQQLPAILQEFAQNIRARANLAMQQRIVDIKLVGELDELFTDGFQGFARMLLQDAVGEDFAAICKKHALTRRCMPCETPHLVLISKCY